MQQLITISPGFFFHFSIQANIQAQYKSLHVDRRSAHLASAHGQCGECVLEALLEAQELDHAEGHGGVEAQAALVGADGAGELRQQEGKAAAKVSMMAMIYMVVVLVSLGKVSGWVTKHCGTKRYRVVCSDKQCVKW